DGGLTAGAELYAERPRPAASPGHRPGRSRVRAAVGPDQPGAPGPPPKTFSRWLRHALLANGITRELTWEDAIGVAQMLVALGRAVPPSRWVESLSLRSADAARE